MRATLTRLSVTHVNQEKGLVMHPLKQGDHLSGQNDDTHLRSAYLYAAHLRAAHLRAALPHAPHLCADPPHAAHLCAVRLHAVIDHRVARLLPAEQLLGAHLQSAALQGAPLRRQKRLKKLEILTTTIIQNA